MARVVIDARESGTGTGRYVDKLIENLHKLQAGRPAGRQEFDFVVLSKPWRVEYLKKLAPDFKIIESDFKEFTFAEQTGFLKQLNSLNANLVHFTMTQQPVLYRGRSVTTIHDLTTIRFSNPAKNPVVFWAKQQVYKLVIKRVAHKSKHIIVPSKFVKNDVAQYAKIATSKISVTYEAADKITAAPAPINTLANQKYIMYVGRPLPHKNLKRLMEAYSIIRNTRDSVKLVLVGKHDKLYERYAQWAQKEHIQGVVFTGFASEGRLRWLYEHATAYVFPSISEGFGLPGLEAMAHGAPVISSNSASLPEIYGDAAEYFNPESTRDMVRVIGNVLENPARRTQLKRLGGLQVRMYSWQKMAKQTLEIYRKALNT
ncbi:MAG TPA: glycosyltransferase family 1 protein [Candidatus Saccharimonadales bacterium]